MREVEIFPVILQTGGNVGTVPIRTLPERVVAEEWGSCATESESQRTDATADAFRRWRPGLRPQTASPIPAIPFPCRRVQDLERSASTSASERHYLSALRHVSMRA